MHIAYREPSNDIIWAEKGAKIWIHYTVNRKSSLSIRVELGEKRGGRINEIPCRVLRKLALRRLASAQDRDVILGTR